MKRLRIAALLAVWGFLAGSAFAAPPPPGAVPSPATLAVTERLPVQHAPAAKGPIVVNWRFKNKSGSVNLTVNPDGTYLFSGTYNRPQQYQDLDVVLALKNHLGGAFVFEEVVPIGAMPHGGLRWSKTGREAVLKDDYKTFGAGHDWAGYYRLRLSTDGQYATCAYDVSELWADTYAPPPPYCRKWHFQYPKWYAGLTPPP